jgi:spore coat polysaccharide biosynthesis protein SpsF
MKVVAIIQARMGSSRLPGKVLMDLGGKTVLARVVRRTRRASLVNQTIVVTTTLAKDDAVVNECQRFGVGYFRGEEENVLDRYYQAALQSSADLIVRITADNPLADPDLIDDVVKKMMESGADYANNRSPRTYPCGLDVEAFKFSALQKARQETEYDYEREHVTPYFYEHPALFQCVSVQGTFDCSHYRWTLDTPADLKLIRKIYARLENRDDFSWQEALAVVQSGPRLASINSHVIQKTLH